MGRKDMVSKRIVEILNGKLLRFTDIQGEYEKLYKKKAFREVSQNLKLLQRKGIVSQIVGRYCLTSDLASLCARAEK